MTEPESDRDPFFVGWLRMPGSYARFLLPLAALLTISAGVVAVLIAGGQRSPGAGKWEEQPTSFVGVVYSEPYAMIRVPSPERGGLPMTLLLVEEGKFGSKDRVRPYDGQSVRVTGTLISRDGWQMVEIADTEEGIRPTPLPEGELAVLRRSPPRALGRVTLRGEIVDSKCYLGAMKPGVGRTHRGCALLCLKGGVPPLFVSQNGGKGQSIYLLTSDTDGPAYNLHLDLAGLPVVVEGDVEMFDDIRIIRVAAQSIHAE